MTRITNGQLDLLHSIGQCERYTTTPGDDYWFFFTQQGYAVSDAQALSDRGLIELSEIEGKPVARLASFGRDDLGTQLVRGEMAEQQVVAMLAQERGLLAQIAQLRSVLAAVRDNTNWRRGDCADHARIALERLASAPSPKITDAELLIILAHEQGCSNYLGDGDILCGLEIAEPEEPCECLRIVRVLREAIENPLALLSPPSTGKE